MPDKSEGVVPPQEKGEKRHTIELKNGGSIVVEETASCIFKIVDNSIADKDCSPMSERTDIGFGKWDESVEDLDMNTSDTGASFGISSHLKWEDVDLKPYEIRAPSLARIKEALQHIEITSYCPGDI